MILFCRLAVVSSFTSFLYVHDCPDKHGAQQTHFSVVTGFLTNFQTPEGHNNFQVLFGLSCYSETSRKQPKMGRFSFRLRQVDEKPKIPVLVVPRSFFAPNPHGNACYATYGVAYGKWSRIYPQGFLPRRRPNTSTF